MIVNHLTQIYLEGLRVLYSAEKLLKKRLPQMARAATSKELRACLTSRADHSKEHLASLEKLFAAMKENPQGERCTRTECLIAEGVRTMKTNVTAERLDRELTTIAQSLEYQEIAGYEWVRVHAKIVHEDAAAALLDAILEEEKATADKLSQLLDRENSEAAGAEVNEPERAGGGSGQWRKSAVMNSEAARD